MSLILTIDTSSEACSVALSANGDTFEKYEVMPRLHARQLLPMIQQVLSNAETKLTQLDAIAFTRGPGSFTGLRIAAGAVQGLAFGSDVPVIPVSTLATLAQGGYRETGCQTIMSVLDARMNELYWGHFNIKENIAVIQGTERLTLPGELIAPASKNAESILGVGQGWQLDELMPCALKAVVKNVLPEFYPRAKDAAVLADYEFINGNILPAEEAVPVYLRGKSAWKK